VALHATAAAPAVLGGSAAALTVGVLAWRRRAAAEPGDDSREMGS
jgi:hypothetical protein